MVFTGLGTAIAGGGALALISRCGCQLMLDMAPRGHGSSSGVAAGERRNPNVPGLGGHEREMSCCVSKTYLVCGRVLVDMGMVWIGLN